MARAQQTPNEGVGECGLAFDVLLWHRWLYYVLTCPVWSDRQYDQFERATFDRWPWLKDFMGPGSDDPRDYEPYVRDARRPNMEERRGRDARLTRGEREWLLGGL
jgi:hypothetical protein